MFEEIRVKFDQALGVGDGQGSLVCCSPLDHKELDMNEWLNWTDSWKSSQHWKGNSQSSPRGTKSPIQDKPKEKYTKANTTQTKIKHKKYY